MVCSQHRKSCAMQSFVQPVVLSFAAFKWVLDKPQQHKININNSDTKTYLWSWGPWGSWWSLGKHNRGEQVTHCFLTNACRRLVPFCLKPKCILSRQRIPQHPTCYSYYISCIYCSEKYLPKSHCNPSEQNESHSA